MVRKGFYFSFDALLAATIVFMSFLMFYTMDLSGTMQGADVKFQEADHIAEDSVQLILASEMSQAFSQSRRDDLVNSTALEPGDMNNSVMDAIAILWASNQTDEARELARDFFASVIPDDYDFRVKVNNENESVIYNTSADFDNSSIVARSTRLVSGVARNRPTQGYTAQASLTDLGAVKSEYFYFGGYAGDGNITVNLTLPEYQNIVSMAFEGDVDGRFNMSINGNDSGMFDPTSGNLSADMWTVCNQTYRAGKCGLFEPGSNRIGIDFLTNGSSVGGGFVRVRYNKSESLDAQSGRYQTRREPFPGIQGVPNIFSSFHVPGTLHGISAKLHFKTNHTIFLNIANKTVYTNNTNVETTDIIPNSTLASNLSASNLTLDLLSNRTVPVRLGIRNFSEIGGLNVDSVSVIDVSGSMGDDPDGDGTTLLDEAKNASKTFVDVILEHQDNRVGMAAYEAVIAETHPLTTDNQSIKNDIDGLSAGGNTCIGCGILEAINLLDDQVTETILPKKSEWLYNTSYPDSSPPDIDGKNWTEQGYNDTHWSNDTAILGFGTDADSDIGDNGGDYFFRKTFSFDRRTQKDPTIFVRSNDAASIYLNGVLLDNDTSAHDGRYWNKIIGGMNPVFEDDFDSGGIAGDTETIFTEDFSENNLNANWTVTAGTEDDEVDVTNDCGSTSGNRALVQRWSASEVETKEINLSQESSVFVDYQMKQGGDDGPGNKCENPEGGDDIHVEYYASDGTWNEMKLHDGGSSEPAEGNWESFSVSVPDDGLHDGFKLRYRYSGGSGSDYDYWAVDDVEIKSGESRWIVTQGSFDDEIAINEECGYRSDPYAMLIRWGGGTVESKALNLSSYDEAQARYSFRQGGDDGPNGNCENPEGGDNDDVYTEYYASDGTWKELTLHEAGGDSPSQGQWQDFSFSLPDDALHDGFKIRYRYPSASGEDYDYWAVDDVRIGPVNPLDDSLFNDGSNLIAAHLKNNNTTEAEFDLAINVTEKRNQSMIVMSDGVANIETEMDNVPDHNNDSNVDALDHTIEAGCRAWQNHSIRVYAVGFGDGADNETLNLTAQCGDGTYYFANTGELVDIFKNISESILEASTSAQRIDVVRGMINDTLYPDSYLELNYSTPRNRDFGTFLIKQESERFRGNVSSPKNGSFRVPEQTEIKDARVTSYSSKYWTDRMLIQNSSGMYEHVYRLWDFGSDYEELGDPYFVHIPPSEIVIGAVNNVSIDTGLSQTQPRGGSPDSRVIYELIVEGFVGYGDVFDKSVGGNRTFESHYGNFTVQVGDASDSWEPNTDAMDNATERLMDKLDVDGDGIIDFQIDSDDIRIDKNSLSGLRWLWGPARVSVEVWR